MPSLRARLFTFALKHRNTLRLGKKKEPVDWSRHQSILTFREQCEAGAKRFGKIPAGIEIQPVSANGLTAEWILPEGAGKEKVIFFIHGGGYVSGSCSDHRVHVAKFVQGSGLPALLFEYRLAPEHRYPAALDDSVKAYEWLLAQGLASANIVFAGDSAGGGLCLATLLALRDKNIPLPAAAAVLSPWTDLKCTGESYITNANVCLSPQGTWTAFSKHYVGDQDATQPWISPLYGDVHGLPPLFISAGDQEILLDDARRFAEKAQKAGVDVTLQIGQGLFHCYPVCGSLFPEAQNALIEICDFIKKHAGKSGQRSQS
jgi:epsilon-lactone hydrolase